MADQCYFNGEFYQCVTATAAGETPLTAPAKWRRIQLPKDWRWCLSQLAYAHLLKLDGQHDKAAVERAQALGMERNGLDALVRRAAMRERHLKRPNVQTSQYRC